MLSNRLYKKVKICSDLSQFCDLLEREIRYTHTPIKDIIQKSNLSFVDEKCLYNRASNLTSLSKKENDDLADFIYSLGKSDIATQLLMINKYKHSINDAQRKYNDLYHSKSKIYISLGVCFGSVLTLVLL